MVRLLIDVNNISQVLDYYDVIKIYRADAEAGPWDTEITSVSTRIPMLPEKTQYYYSDVSGDNTNWYKVTYFKEPAGAESDITLSAALQGGTDVEKIGYTFDNYSPPPGEWGKVYTADDMRYTMLYGIDCVGSDIAQSTFEDSQFDQLVREALGEFEDYLTMDIRKRVYKTNPASTLTRGRT